MKSAKKVFLGGMLQGCCLAMATYLHLSPHIQLGGVFGNSGGHVLSSWQTSFSREKRQTPIVLYHGALDVMVPLAKAKMGYSLLKEQGITHLILKVEDDQHHNISSDAMRDMTCFCRRHMTENDTD